MPAFLLAGGGGLAMSAITISPGFRALASGLPSLAAVHRLEADLLKMPQANIKTDHRFRPGFYERTITIPPWTVLTGAEHLTDYTVRLERGTIAVNTDDGVKVLTAPFQFEAKAGIKRAGRVFEDEVVWTDVYANLDDCTDIPTIEARLYSTEVELGENRIAKAVDAARLDFAVFLLQIGKTQADMDAIVQNKTDLIPMPEGFGVEVRESVIDGLGMFATREFGPGEFICPGRLNGHRTPAGRFINHSPTPNAIGKKLDNGDIVAIATKRIQQNEEVFLDYRNSMRINFGIAIEGESK